MLYTKNQRSTEGTDVIFYSCSALLESMLELKSFASYLLSMTSANHTAFRKNICLLCKWGIGRETVIFSTVPDCKLQGTGTVIVFLLDFEDLCNARLSTNAQNL